MCSTFYEPTLKRLCADSLARYVVAIRVYRVNARDSITSRMTGECTVWTIAYVLTRNDIIRMHSVYTGYQAGLSNCTDVHSEEDYS